LSTEGNGAHGDFAGGGAGLFAVKVGLSFCPLDDTLVVFVCCLSAFAPTLRTVAFGPTEVDDLEESVFEASCAVDGSVDGGTSFTSLNALVS